MFITVKNSGAIYQFLVYNSTTYSITVQGIYLEEFTTNSILLFLYCCFVVILLKYASKPLWNFQVTALSTMLFTVKLFWKKKIIKDHWFIIYAMIHVFNWKMCLLDHSKIIHPLFSPSLIWQLDLNNTLKQMALGKKLCKGETETLEFLTAATVLSFWKIVPLLILSTTLWSEKKGIYIFKLQSFEIYVCVRVRVCVGVCVCVCIYIYIIDR